MGKVLFIPMNTNHVIIFDSILSLLQCESEVLCHDRITEMDLYHTESILKKLQIPYVHFSKKIDRSQNDFLLYKIVNFFHIKNQVKTILEIISPDLIVLAIDNDPIAQIFIKEAKRKGIQTLLIQEALIRPHEYTMRETYLSDYLYRFLKLFGIYLKYIKYGTGDCDKILVGGNIAFEIMKERGVSENRISIVGHPKYDNLVKRIKDVEPVTNEKNIYFFPASTKIIHDNQSIKFLKILVETIQKLNSQLIIKLHPRGTHEPTDIHNILELEDTSFLEIIKKGDEAFEIMRRSDALITVSSTVILDALMLNKECIIASYLAGESRLEYDAYDATFSIKNENEIHDVIKMSLLSKKSYQNKKRLLEDELYKLDGQASKRVVNFIERMIS